MRLGMLISAAGFGQLAGLEIDIVVTLAGAVDAIGPMHAGVEPLRRVGRCHLHRQHVTHFVIIGEGVLLACEVSAFPAPIGPGAGQPVKNLLG